MKSKLKKVLRKARRKFTEYISTNRLFMAFVIISLIGVVIVRGVTIGNWFDTKPLFFDFALILIIGSFGYLINAKKQFRYFATCLIIISIMCIINSVYYTFYSSFASFGLLASAGQVGDVADSLVEKLRLIDFIYVLGVLFFYFINHELKKTTYYHMVAKVERGKKMCAATMLVGIIFLAFSMISLTGTDYSRLSKQWNRVYIVERFGIIVYQGNDLVQSLTPKISSIFGYDEAKKTNDEFYKKNTYTDTNNKYTDMFDGYNVVYVHMESMQAFLMDLSFNGLEAVPNVNKLASEGMFFSNFYAQISTGTSSDTEFTLNSSLLPALSGTVAVSYADREYVTTPKLLKEKGYYTYSMHANTGDMWNRNVFHTTLGYDKFYSKSSFDVPSDTDSPDWVGLGLSDKSFFSQAIPMMEDIEKNNTNYMGTLLMLSNHSPFSDITKYGEYDLSQTVSRINEKTNKPETVVDDFLSTTKMGNYIRSAHYADQALGEFINYINTSKYFDKTIFVFYGDHDAKLSSSEFNNLYNYDYKTGTMKEETDPDYYDYDEYEQELNRKTPLIIWTKNPAVRKKINVKVDYVMGMYDVLPTVGNMMGFSSPYALGHDIFTIKDDNVVIFPNGNFLTNKVYYNNSTGMYKILVKGAVLDDNYIDYYKKYTEDRLEVSNNIIVYDLIGKKNNEEMEEVNDESKE